MENKYNINELEEKNFIKIFGSLIVKVNNQKSSYKPLVKRCVVEKKDGVYTELNKIEIETKNLKMNDKIDIIFDTKNDFKFYGTGEHTCMIYAKKKNALCVFVGYDTDYSFDEFEFYNCQNYCYAIKSYDQQGFHYEIVKNPSEYSSWDKGHIIELWYAILPINGDEDIEQKLLDFFIKYT